MQSLRRGLQDLTGREPPAVSPQTRTTFAVCLVDARRRLWQHWLAWRALRVDVRSPQPREPSVGQGGVLLRAFAAGRALVRLRPTRTCHSNG